MTGKPQSQIKEALVCRFRDKPGLIYNVLRVRNAGNQGSGGHIVRLLVLLISSLFVLSACTAPVGTSSGANARGGNFTISARDTDRIRFRMLDSVNVIRQNANVAPVQLDAQLNAAAATHSRDMSNQNRPWHFGSDGSSPLDRVRRVGYTGALVGENISETYESDLDTLAAWMQQPDTRRTILDANARDLGFAWYQESNGKIWWTLIMGNPTVSAPVVSPNPRANQGPSARS